MKKHILILIVTLGTVIGGLSQNYTLPPAPSLFGDHNQVGSISFDLNGVALGKGKNYFNTLGRSTQSLSWDVLTGKVWASESIYDRHGRPSLQTLSAPIGTDLLISNDFILDQGGNTYTYNDFDTGATIENPNPVNSQSELGIYYSSQNTTNPYQDITEYPFVRTVYSKLNPGNGHKTLGGNKIDDEWKQSYSFSMPAGSEIDIYLNNGVPLDSKVIKTVSRDVNKTDVVVFTDSDGNTLLAARSGPHIYYHEYNNVLEIGRQGFVDIHIPERQQGVNTEFDIINPDILLSGPLKVYDLITEELVTTINSSAATESVPSGFYRIAVSNPLLYKDYTSPISVSHVVNYYDASKNEYDKADRLVSSMQPIGGTSTFSYNSLGQLLETTSPDEGTAKFLYRKDGQIRFSQNIKQQNAGEFSYTNYDDLGRPIESGVAVEKAGLINFDQLEPYVDNNSILDSHDKKEVHKTIYDLAVFGNAVLTGDLCGLPIQDYKQTFVAGNVSNTSTEFPATSTTWYSYDVQGRVQWMIQKIAGLECYKTLNYKYDPATGQVIEVDYQRHDADERFIHRYEYNTAGQLEKVYTSRTGLDNSWEEQANYFYAESGELVRTVLAENLQGIDYVYNLNGQLKAINHPSLAANNDPGQDGALGSLIPADVFGFSIDYYDGDYTRTGTPTPIAQENTNGVDQYNGNIKGVGFNTDPNGSGVGTISPNFQSYMYEYNKNNWLQKATYGTGNVSSTGNGGYKTNFTPNPDSDYEVSNLQYDANGNITTLKRNGYTDNNGTNDMDQFSYSYNGNKLLTVWDSNDNSDPDRYNDLKDQLNSNNGNENYTYNEIGQLISDISGKAFYEYNASGLVRRIKTFGDNGSAQDEQYFFDDYSSATQNALYPWSVSSGIKSVNYAGTYIPNTGATSCVTLDNLYGKSIFFELPDDATATGIFDVIPNVPNTFELDLIIDQWDGSQAATGYHIYIFDASLSFEAGTITPTPIAEVSYNENLDYIGGSGGIGSCSKFYDRHESLTFTPSTSKIRIQIKKITVGGSEPIYIDNISLAAGTVPILDFAYNDRGHRVRKTTYSIAGGDTRQTFYVRDASGTAIAIYSKVLSAQKPANESKLDELPVYGASRLGVYTLNYGLSEPQGDPIDGFYRYELTDHLGNVRAVIGKASDDTPYVVAKTDYYPFGMPMPDRTIEGNYRYAYQGQEKDPETGMEAFELRLWDARIGRWQNPDPAGQFYSPYLGMANDPINAIDEDGDWIKFKITKTAGGYIIHATVGGKILNLSDKSYSAIWGQVSSQMKRLHKIFDNKSGSITNSNGVKTSVRLKIDFQFSYAKDLSQINPDDHVVAIVNKGRYTTNTGNLRHASYAELGGKYSAIQFDQIAAIPHEIAHNLGLDDLYDKKEYAGTKTVNLMLDSRHNTLWPEQIMSIGFMMISEMPNGGEMKLNSLDGGGKSLKSFLNSSGTDYNDPDWNKYD